MTAPKSLSQRTRENAEENARLRRAVMALREALEQVLRSFSPHPCVGCSVCGAAPEDECRGWCVARTIRAALAEHNV